MKDLCHELAVALFDKYDEPMPPFELHDHSRLLAALANPSRMFDGADLYSTLVEKAAVLYYSLVKGHAFENGNKRVATTSLLVFLLLNQHWIACTKDDLVRFAVSVAEVPSAESQNELRRIASWISEHLTDTAGLHQLVGSSN